MSDKRTVIGDKMIEAQLNENSDRLNISVDDLIENYIRRGLYRDLYYENTPLNKSKLSQVIKIDKNADSKWKSDDVLVDIYTHDD